MESNSPPGFDRSNFYTTGLTAMIVQDEDEAIDSARIKSECGAMVMASVHYAYDQWRNFGHQPPNAMSRFGTTTRDFLKIIRRIEDTNGYTWDIIVGSA